MAVDLKGKVRNSIKKRICRTTSTSPVVEIRKKELGDTIGNIKSLKLQQEVIQLQNPYVVRINNITFTIKNKISNCRN